MNKKLTGVLSGLLLGMAGMQAQSWTNVVNEGTGSFSSSQIRDFDKWPVGAGYSVGKFAGSNVVFGATTLNNTTAATAYFDAFLCKTNGLGAVTWAVRAGGTNDQSFEKVISLNTGAAIVYGTYSGSITFYSTNTTTMTLTGGSAFLAKYSSSGVIQWAVPFTGTVNDFDFKGNTLYTIGAESVVIYPATPRLAVKSFDILTGAAGSINLVSTTTGVFGKGVGVDNSNNIYVLIEAASNFKMGTSPNFTTVTQDIFILKYDAAGYYVWSRQIDNIGGGAKYATDLDCDGTDLYITGGYDGGSIYMDFPSTTAHVLTNTGARDAFVAKYDNTGAIQWARKIGGTGNDVAIEMAATTDGPSVVIQNQASNAVTLPGLCTTETYTSSGSASDNKWYVAKYTPTGDLDYSAAPEVVYSNAFPVGISASGTSASVAGSLTGQMYFGGTSLIGGSVYFATAYKVSCKPGVATGIEEQTANDVFSVYPNPGMGVFTIDAEAFVGGQLEVYDINGKNIQSLLLDGSMASKTINLTGYSKGIYLLNLTFEGKGYSKKLILE